MSDIIKIKPNGDIEIKDTERNTTVSVIQDKDSEHPATFTYIKHVDTINIG